MRQRCAICLNEIKPDCDYRQGRCPHRPAAIIISDPYKSRFLNLINSIKNLFK